MYTEPWHRLPGFRGHRWTARQGGQTIAEVARTIAEAGGIRDGDLLVGSSFGGMVACEITKIRRIPKLFLVGSAVQREEVSPLLAALHPLARYAPIEWATLSAGSIPTELCRMFATVEPSFIRAMCAAVFRWEGGANPETLVYRLHGRRDLVIPPPPNPDLLVAGGHLIAITHAQECARYVAANRFARQTTPGTP